MSKKNTGNFLTVSHVDSVAHILPHHEQLQPALVGHQKPPEVLSGFWERIGNSQVPDFGLGFFGGLFWVVFVVVLLNH